MHLKSGALLQGGKYRVESVLGQGGFGITYLAEQTGLNRKVAIKEFFMKEHCERSSDTSAVSLGTSGSREMVLRFKDKFIRETQMIASMKHSNIVNVHEVFEENNTAYYVMEYLPDGSLNDFIPVGGLSEDVALMYIRQLADALRYIHEEKHILHLDVKPANVLLRHGDEAVLIDFGISKHYDEAGGGQTSSTPVGVSKGYAPLEQYKVGGVAQFSPATDIYSLGATLYKLLTGTVPPDANDVYEDGLPMLPAKVSAVVRVAVEKAMHPRRKDRPQSVTEFLELLQASSSSAPTSPPPPPSFMRPVPPPPPPPLPSRQMPVEDEAATVLVGDESDCREWVNLGLPSGLKWATCNLGASSPEEYGCYYAWGEIAPSKKYDIPSCRTWGRLVKEISGKSRYDAARNQWGDEWFMPSRFDFEELQEFCGWEWTVQNGHGGYRVIGPNGNSIFLPAAGWCVGNKENAVGEEGEYWSSTSSRVDLNGAFCLRFKDGHLRVGVSYRSGGRCVRPVRY